MRDISQIDWKSDYSKIVEGDPGKILKQKVFFLQNGVEYNAAGIACNAKQVKDYYTTVAADAQKMADDAKLAATEAQANADAAIKNAGITKTAAKKAAA